jgi:hypothetical protein
MSWYSYCRTVLIRPLQAAQSETMIDSPLPALDASCPSEHSRPLASRRVKRWSIAIASGILFLLIAGVLGFRIAIEMLKGRVVEALGAGSEVQQLNLGWSSIDLLGLTIRGPKGWPAARALYAERVRIVPSLRSLLSNRVEITSIEIDNPYFSVVRIPGKLLILPGLFEPEQGNKNSSTGIDANASSTVVISKIVLNNGAMELFDKTVSQPPLKIRLEQIQAVIRDVAPADLSDRTRFEFKATAKGKNRDGDVKVSGWVAAAGKDSSSHILMKNVELVSLQPYLVKKGDARVNQGTLDLNLKSEVRNNQLHGIGNMVFKNLEFAPSQSYLDRFMGLPRSTVINFLKDHNNAIDMDFTLSGDIRQPNFSLNETLATRIATGMAAQLGVSLQGVAEGLETLGRKGLEGATGTANVIGSTIRNLFGGADP